MVASYTSRKRLEKQNPGENNNTWGGFLNVNTTDLIDECFGVVCVAMTTAGDSTLSTQNGLTDEGRRTQIILTGAPTSNVRLFVPAVQSPYIVRNKMTGAFRVKLTNAGGVNGVDFSGSGSGAEQGLVVSDGTNVREVFRTVSAGSFTIFTKGMIMPFFNSVGAIPTGWVNCDGTNNTPNLNDKFILGTTSATNIDTSGGSLSSITTTSGGNHTHTGLTGSTTLVSANIPAHSHRMFVDETVASTISLATQKATTANQFGSSFDTAIGGLVTSAEPDLGITSWAYSSAATGHTHTISTETGHTHSITPVRPPYHYMLYIMKT